MDIGTAKPSAQELATVPHHLINIRDPLQPYSAAEFVRDAGPLLQGIRGRGRRPLLVGGTMLYFKALFHGIDDMPPANAAVRTALDERARAIGWPAMHAELANVDAASAARLAPNDSQRIQRALEVFTITGLPLSHFQRRQGPINSDPVDTDPGNDFHLVSLEPSDRGWLHTRIARRFDAMLDAGLLDEVRALRARGDLHADLPSMRCVGYRQAWDALDGTLAMAELRDRGIFATRQLAKRQITWLRSMPQREVVAADASDALEQTLTAAARVLA